MRPYSIVKKEKNFFPNFELIKKKILLNDGKIHKIFHLLIVGYSNFMY